MKLIKIIATSPVRYSSDNGLTLTEYEPGGVYEASEHVASGMVKRRWARPFDPQRDAPAETAGPAAGEAGAEAGQESSKTPAARDVAEKPAPAAGGTAKPQAPTPPAAAEPRRKGGKS